MLIILRLLTSHVFRVSVVKNRTTDLTLKSSYCHSAHVINENDAICSIETAAGKYEFFKHVHRRFVLSVCVKYQISMVEYVRFEMLF